MANFDTHYFNPVSTDWLFPATSGSYTYFTATATYFEIFTAGHIVRYVGTGITASGSGPTGGTITSIELRSFSGATVFATLSAFASFNAVDFASPGLPALVFAGVDNFVGGDGSDTLSGGNGNDVLRGDGANASNDVIHGGAGIDIISYWTTNGVNLTLAEGGSGTFTVFGTDTYDGIEGIDGSNGGADTLIGNTSNNWLRGFGGADFIAAGAGDDTLEGGDGNDTLEGAVGFDSMLGGDGDDEFRSDSSNSGEAGFDGGAGSDVLIIDRSSPNPLLNTGLVISLNQVVDVVNTWNVANIERLNATGSERNDSITGGTFDDTIYGHYGDDTLDGGLGLDSLFGGNGNDVLKSLAGNTRESDFHGDDGTDYLWLDRSTASTGITVTPSIAIEDIGGIWIFNEDIEGLIAYGGSGNDSLTGGEIQDTLVGGAGNDTLSGNGGDDAIDGGTGVDALDGGGGNDLIILDFSAQPSALSFSVSNLAALFTFANGTTAVNFERSNLRSGSGNDSILGGTLADTLSGGGGNDTLDGGLGADNLFGGAGDDVLYGGGGSGQAIIYGDDGNDLIVGGDGLDNLYGGVGNDTIDGGAGSDLIEGGDGDDVIDGGGGPDYLKGGEGNDILKSLTGNTSEHEINGGLGIDTLIINRSAAVTDLAIILLTSITDIVGTWALNGLERLDATTGSGSDTLTGGGDTDTLDGGLGSDSINGGGGDDIIRSLVGNTFETFVDGGGGNDTLVLNRSNATVDLYLSLTTVSDIGGFWSAQNMERLEGTTGSGNDELVGGALADVLIAGAGTDTLTGGDGADYLQGDGGNDTLNGDGGDDTLRGDAGNDEIHGGAGNDQISFTVSGGVTMTLGAGGAGSIAVAGLGTDTYDGIEGIDGSTAFSNNLTGNSGNNLLRGGNASDTLNGGAGADTLVAGAGADSLDGGSAMDTASYAGSAATVQVFMYNMTYNTGDALGDVFTSIEVLEGSANVDILVGGFLGDSIFGGNGGDWLDGTYGGDSLFGQAGNDSLVSRIQADVLDGGADFDFARYDYADVALRAYIYDTAQNTGWAAGDSFVSIEGLAGSYFADDLRGDNNQNIIYGLGGADYVIGLGGSDLLIGGDGQDLFHFVGIGDGGPGGDAIQDFVSGFDRISVTGQFFGLGSPGGVAIDSSRFVAGTAANLAISQFIYNGATRQLFYDFDGTGAGVQALLATLQAGATVAAGDIIVI
jgi:Ca2+-binding RTX toxin-like protein